MGVLAASLLGTLLLNTAMAQGEYDRFALQTELTRAAQEEQRLAGEQARLESPAQIADAAARKGMVPSTGGGYLRLSDGAVLGNPSPAGADR
jgi:type II secretory pathway pseudopilin PulG